MVRYFGFLGDLHQSLDWSFVGISLILNALNCHFKVNCSGFEILLNHHRYVINENQVKESLIFQSKQIGLETYLFIFIMMHNKI